MPIFNVGLSYPKPRDLFIKAVPIARADSSTVKCVIPKDSVVMGVFVHQQVVAATAAATFNLGTSGTPTGLLSSFSMATGTSVGFVTGAAATGALVGTKLAADATIISSYTVGSSTAGGTGVVYIAYYVAGPGEDPTD
jgi:hypothetical protein